MSEFEGRERGGLLLRWGAWKIPRFRWTSKAERMGDGRGGTVEDFMLLDFTM